MIHFSPSDVRRGTYNVPIEPPWTEQRWIQLRQAVVAAME